MTANLVSAMSGVRAGEASSSGVNANARVSHSPPASSSLPASPARGRVAPAASTSRQQAPPPPPPPPAPSTAWPAHHRRRPPAGCDEHQPLRGPLHVWRPATRPRPACVRIVMRGNLITAFGEATEPEPEPPVCGVAILWSARRGYTAVHGGVPENSEEIRQHRRRRAALYRRADGHLLRVLCAQRSARDSRRLGPRVRRGSCVGLRRLSVRVAPAQVGRARPGWAGAGR